MMIAQWGVRPAGGDCQTAEGQEIKYYPAGTCTLVLQD
jgi:hypothetical protein